MESIKNAIAALHNAPEFKKNFLIMTGVGILGALLSAVCLNIIVSIFMLGFYMMMLISLMKKEQMPFPVIDKEIQPILINGLKLTGTSLIYSFVISIVIVPLTFIAMFLSVFTLGIPMFLLAILLVAVTILFMYIWIAILLRFAVNQDFVETLNLKSIWAFIQKDKERFNKLFVDSLILYVLVTVVVVLAIAAAAILSFVLAFILQKVAFLLVLAYIVLYSIVGIATMLFMIWAMFVWQYMIAGYYKIEDVEALMAQ